MRILVVEDDKRVGGLLEQLLRQEEYEVERGYDGEQAIALALAGHYDLILLDFMLPKQNGPAVARTLREHGRQTPILMLTARDAPEDIQLCMDSGVDGYVTKPFRFNDLLAEVQRLSGIRAAG
jgi:DNA-binding response OmpR family regulator